MSLFTAVILCTVLARVNPPRWHKGVLVALAAVFFSFAYIDERALNTVEDHLSSFVATIPTGQRVVVVLSETAHSPISPFTHIVDRPCVGRCFDYGDYEPATGHFRLRATHANPYVLASTDAIGLEAGHCVVNRQDSELYQMHLCDAKTLRFCETRLVPGQLVKADQISVLPRLR